MNEECFFWATFEGRSGGEFVYAMEGGEAAARAIAEQKGAVVSLKTLPYPSKDLPPDARFPQGFPGFCYSPGQCAGRSSCPKRYACSE